MPRVTERTARKDYPNSGIKKGEKYFFWRIKLSRGGRSCRSKTYPRPSQLNLGFAGQLGDLQQDLDAATDLDGLRSLAEEIRSLGEEQQEKFDNMPEGLQQGDTGQLLEERANGCEEWADAIETACDEADSKLDGIEDRFQAWQEYDDALAEHDDNDPDAVEPDEPDGERPEGDTVEDAIAQIIDEAKDEAGSACPL